MRDAYLQGKRVEQFTFLVAMELKEARASLSPTTIEMAAVLVSLGNDFLTLGDNMQAEELLEEGFNIRKQVAPDLWNTFNAQSLLGGAKLAKALALESETEAEVKAKLLAEAEPLLVQGYEGMKQRESAIPSEAPDVLPEALDRLIALYDALAKPEEVAKYRELRSQYSIPEPSARKTGK